MKYPKFSIIVPVFHEGNRINHLIEHLNHLDLKKAVRSLWWMEPGKGIP